MAESRAPSANKAKRITAIGRVNAQERARQYKEDMYALMMVFFFASSVSTVDTIKDHLKSKKHRVRKAAKASKAEKSLASSSRQVTLSIIFSIFNLCFV